MTIVEGTCCQTGRFYIYFSKDSSQWIAALAVEPTEPIMVAYEVEFLEVPARGWLNLSNVPLLVLLEPLLMSDAAGSSGGGAKGPTTSSGTPVPPHTPPPRYLCQPAPQEGDDGGIDEPEEGDAGGIDEPVAAEEGDDGGMEGLEAEEGDDGEGGSMDVHGKLGVKGEGKTETVNKGYIYDKGTKGKGGKVLSGPITEQHEGMPNPRILKNKHGFNGPKLDR